jgi:hypothetical protein
LIPHIEIKTTDKMPRAGRTQSPTITIKFNLSLYFFYLVWLLGTPQKVIILARKIIAIDQACIVAYIFSAFGKTGLGGFFMCSSTYLI